MRKTIYNDLYCVTIVYMIGTHEELINYCSRKNPQADVMGAIGTESYGKALIFPNPTDERMEFILWINDIHFRKDTQGILNTMAHESSHITGMIINHIGEPDIELDSEFIAYLNGYNFNNIHSLYEKFKKKYNIS